MKLTVASYVSNLGKNKHFCKVHLHTKRYDFVAFIIKVYRCNFELHAVMFGANCSNATDSSAILCNQIIIRGKNVWEKILM